MIELLITIGTIAVIAAFVIMIINPIEQLKRSRDASRMNTAEQLVKAVQAYNLQNNSWPSIGTTWMDTLKNANELPTIPLQVTGQYTCDGGLNQFQENGFCYNQSTTNTNHIAVYVVLEASMWQTACNTNFPVPSYPTTLPTWVYTTALGRSGVACVDSTKGVNWFTDDTDTSNLHFLPGQ